jgi:hypothetical protein
MGRLYKYKACPLTIIKAKPPYIERVPRVIIRELIFPFVTAIPLINPNATPVSNEINRAVSEPRFKKSPPVTSDRDIIDPTEISISPVNKMNVSPMATKPTMETILSTLITFII